MEPAAQSVTIPHRTESSHKNQERRLKRVISVVRIAEDASTNIQDHRTVAIDQLVERHLRPGALGLESIQQLPVGQRSDVAHAKQRAELFVRCAVSSRRHGPAPVSYYF
jgi:hypothetical protein